jgi:hypothetical protein
MNAGLYQFASQVFLKRATLGGIRTSGATINDVDFNCHRENKLKNAGVYILLNKALVVFLKMGVPLGVVEEYIRLKNMTSPDGMWLMPRVNSHIWDGIYFCRKGPNSPSIMRFFIDNEIVKFDSGAKIKASFKLAEDPEAFQSYIKEKCDRGEIQYDKIKSFEYDTLYDTEHCDTCIRFNDTFSLKELCDEVSTS